MAGIEKSKQEWVQKQVDIMKKQNDFEDNLQHYKPNNEVEEKNKALLLLIRLFTPIGRL